MKIYEGSLVTRSTLMETHGWQAAIRASATSFAASVLLCAALFGYPASALGDSESTISSAIVDETAGELTITGAGFPDDPLVTFNGVEAVILGTPTTTEIVIELPPGTPNGSYRITVGEWTEEPECFDDDEDCFEVAVRAIGPTGMEDQCPVFNTSMVDAVASQIQLIRERFAGGVASDDQDTGELFCDIFFTGSRGGRIFIQIQSLGRARVISQGGAQAINLSVDELRACREEVLQSFVWNRYCTQVLSP